MKQTLIFTLSFFAIATFMTACSGQVADKMAAVGDPTYSSDPCAAIDEKVMRLNRFTAVVQNNSAFHLEEKATALQVPGITVSNNKKHMLRDAEKKYAEYAAERQAYGCKTPMPASTVAMANKKAGVSQSTFSADTCDAIDRKLLKLDEFTAMVNHTSAFHLEEKAAALQVPGITVSNNKKHMLRDVEKKKAELLQERQEYGCKAPVPASTAKMAVIHKPALSSDSSADIDTKMMKSDALTTKVNSTSTVPVEAKAAAVPVAEIAVKTEEQMVTPAEKKDTALEEARQKQTNETPVAAGAVQLADKKTGVSKPALSSDTCDAINEKLIKLYEFMIMVNNTSAFHLEEKATALSVPEITKSTNKKKMLKDAEKKQAALLAEQQKYGCQTSTK